MDTALAPGYGKLTYSGTLFPHHLIMPINFDGTPTPGVEPDIVLKDASTISFSSAFAGFLTEFRPFFGSATNFGLVEVHAVDATTGEDTFIWGYNANVTGTGTGTNTPLSQLVQTFKLIGGGVYKLFAMEGLITVNNKTFPPYGGVPESMSDFITGAGSPVYGRDNTYPFAPISMTTKTNDALRKQHGLS
jgi:hypothetical protein